MTLSMYMETSQGIAKLDPASNFLSHGLRVGKTLEIFAEPSNGKGDVLVFPHFTFSARMLSELG